MLDRSRFSAIAETCVLDVGWLPCQNRIRRSAMFLMAYSLHQLWQEAAVERQSAARSGERLAGATPPALPRNCRLAGPVPLLFTLDVPVTPSPWSAPSRAGM